MNPLTERPSPGVLLELEQLVMDGVRDDTDETLHTVVEPARRRAERLQAADPTGGDWIAGASYAADLLTGLWLERSWDAPLVDRVVSLLATRLQTTRATVGLDVYLRALNAPGLLTLPPMTAVETQLRMLMAFARASAVSLWRGDRPPRRLECVFHTDGEPPGRPVRNAARKALAAAAPEPASGRALHQAFVVTRWEEPHAAIVVSGGPGPRSWTSAIASETALAVGHLLESDALLARSAERERSLVESSERRLVRLGFDLHDGPIQDVIALSHELEHFRSQLESALGDRPDARLVLGRVADLEARLRALDADLRELASSLNAPALMRVPLEELLEGEVGAFESRSGIGAELRVEGELGGLTTSARVALLRLVQEALANVQHHSGARSVSVGVRAGRGRIAVTVEDDGAGFDVERRLVDAARAGRLGLVGMSERIRLLGGRFDVRSEPGGPTVVAASFPHWRSPLTGPDESLADLPTAG